MRNTRIGWKQGAGMAAVAACATLVLGACGRTAAARSTTRPRRTSRRPRRRATAATSTWRSTRGSATRPTPTWSARSWRPSSAARSNYKDLKEDVSWQGFGTGEVDVVIEDWGHPDLEKKFFAESGDGSAMDFGPTGNVGIIGWYVPPWLAKEHPDILDYKNLNNYAKDFATSESGGKGQFLGADPSYVQFDEAIVSNLGLDFKVVFSGSEAASITAFQQAEKNKEFLIGYFYEPQWLFADIPLERVSCRRTPTAARTTRPRSPATTRRRRCKKVVSTSWVEEGGPAVDLVKNFQWTNDDQNVVAKYISEDGMKPEDAAAKWIDDNQDKVDAWLG